MSKLTINVDVMLGTDLIEALEDAKELARRMDVAYVCFKFNGVGCSVSQDADTTKMYYDYQENRVEHGVVG